MLHAEIRRIAAAAHASIHPNLQHTNPLIGAPEIFDSLAGAPYAPVRGDGHDLPRELEALWHVRADHALLEETLAAGYLPRLRSEARVQSEFVASSIEDTWRVEQLESRERAIRVGEFLVFGEDLAWKAAQALVRGEQRCFRRPLRDTHARWRDRVLVISRHFSVPTRGKHESSAVDQLWLVLDRDWNRIRRIVLEIDSEARWASANKEFEADRARELTALGYEVYRAAAWWARIDPYRLIAEFLVAANILPEALSYLKFGLAAGLNEYYCNVCGEPLVRWEPDWVTEGQAGRATHSMCAHHIAGHGL